MLMEEPGELSWQEREAVNQFFAKAQHYHRMDYVGPFKKRDIDLDAIGVLRVLVTHYPEMFVVHKEDVPEMNNPEYGDNMDEGVRKYLNKIGLSESLPLDEPQADFYLTSGIVDNHTIMVALQLTEDGYHKVLQHRKVEER